jgi:hypothetical protein
VAPDEGKQEAKETESMYVVSGGVRGGCTWMPWTTRVEQRMKHLQYIQGSPSRESVMKHENCNSADGIAM